MRVRDLRWYFLAGLILIISYAAMAVCYYLSIRNGKVENSMKQLGLEAAKAESATLDDRLSQYCDMYYEDTNDSLTYMESNYPRQNQETAEEWAARKEAAKKAHLFELAVDQSGLFSRFRAIEGTETI